MKVNLILNIHKRLNGTFLRKKKYVLLQLLDHFNDVCHLEVYVAYSYYLVSYNFSLQSFSITEIVYERLELA